MNELIARTQIVDPKSGRHLKRIDERSLSDFFSLITQSTKESRVLYVPDLTPLINSVNDHVSSLLESESQKELRIIHGTVYNMWNKAKVAKIQSVKEKLNIEVLTGSEQGLHTIHERLYELENTYISPERDSNGRVNEDAVNSALDHLLSNMRVFIEIALCHIHASVILDPCLIKEPSILNHCQSMKDKLVEWLRKEAGVNLHQDGSYLIHDDSLIYQCCIEDNLEFDAEALIPNLNLSDMKTPSDASNIMLKNIKNKHNGSGYMRYVEWPVANSTNTQRVAKILDVIKQLNSLLSLFQSAEDRDVEYSSDNDVFNEIKTLSLEISLSQ